MKAKNLFIVTILVFALFACTGNNQSQQGQEQKQTMEEEQIDSSSAATKVETETPANEVLVLQQDMFEKTIQGGTFLVDFYADWCKPCKEMHPILEKFAADNGTKIRVCKINIDNAQEIARKYEITGIPCFVVFKDGKDVLKLVGSRDMETLKQELSEYIK